VGQGCSHGRISELKPGAAVVFGAPQSVFGITDVSDPLAVAGECLAGRDSTEIRNKVTRF
jgi:hypothetical protein